MSSQFNDSDDDVALPTRRSSLDGYPAGAARAAELPVSRAADREVTLNTGIVLALFFALALLCAVFFGFGYSIGHKSAPVPVAADADPTPAPVDTAATPKPTPGSPAAASVPEYVPSGASEKAANTKAGSPATQGNAPAKPKVETVVTEVSPSRVAPVKPAAAALPVNVPATAPSSAPAPSGTNYVQIAAVSHQEDADVLLSALRRRGYAVLTRSDANDKLIHVQVGPFTNRKEAEAMRQKLAGDGYNAFIK